MDANDNIKQACGAIGGVCSLSRPTTSIMHGGPWNGSLTEFITIFRMSRYILVLPW